MPAPNQAAFDFLMTRRSRPAKLFTPPVPDRDALLHILTAATRVPDHGKLEPWRLVVIEKPAFARLADLAEARAVELGADAERTAKGRGQYDLGHLAVVVISAPKAAEKVPVSEQLLSAGALCFGIVNAATAAGWGASWLTGWPAHDPVFRARAFGCTATETVAGIIHIGTPPADAPANSPDRTPDRTPDRPRPDLSRLVAWVEA